MSGYGVSECEVGKSPFDRKMSQREKRAHKRPKHLKEYVLETNRHSSKPKSSEHSKPAENALDCSDENIKFIPPKSKISKLEEFNLPLIFQKGYWFSPFFLIKKQLSFKLFQFNLKDNLKLFSTYNFIEK